ncbi:MAG TPA: acyl carrier protein [Candidatus Competibacter sp.]|nr:acyl carrier protein [Candidatus Competibacteraceae bacterium]HRE55128.1 acyl carrier protein [Candidatus Competibacter sp.]HUM95390.1 acyl carrier protein [Candidatus Competibacter sp.]
MSIERPVILHKVIQVLENMTQDWDMDYAGEIDENVKLVEDLTFASIDIIQLVVALEESFQRRDLPIDKLLLKDGRYVDEIKVSNIVDFLKEHL